MRKEPSPTASKQTQSSSAAQPAARPLSGKQEAEITSSAQIAGSDAGGDIVDLDNEGAVAAAAADTSGGGMAGEDAALRGMTYMKLQQPAKGDPRLYQLAALPNGIQALVIQQPGVQLATIATAVAVGQYSDPAEFLGLAHLTEHAVFLGTKKYPEETGFDEFLSRHGGQTNAYTATDATVYYAQLAPDAFEEGLDRLSDFFHAPLMNISSVWDEVRAVVSEHSNNRHDSFWTMDRMMLSMASPQNPMHSFHTGDHETLEAHGKKELDRAIHRFYEQNYCPSRTKVVTLSSEPLKKQLELIARTFGSIPKPETGCSATPAAFSKVEAFQAESLGHWVRVQGTPLEPELWMVFPLPSSERGASRRTKPFRHLARALSYEGQDSLVYALSNVYGLTNSFAPKMESTPTGTVVWLEARLTQKGFDNIGSVMGVVFAYLAKIRCQGVTGADLEALADDAKLRWEWGDPDDAEAATQSFAEDMTRVPPDELLGAGELIEEPSEEAVRRYLEHLVPANMNAGVIYTPSAATPRPQEKQETLPHYDAKYSKSTLAHEFGKDNVAAWSRWFDECRTPEKMENELLVRMQGIDPTLQELPKAVPPRPIKANSQFISLDHATANAGASKVSKLFGQSPVRVVADDEGANRLFFREGWTRPGPQVWTTVFLQTPVDVHAKEMKPEAKLMHSLSMELLNDGLKSRMADIMNAGTSYSLAAGPDGITISFEAFRPNVADVSQKLLEEARRGAKPTPVQFKRALESLHTNVRLCTGGLDMAEKEIKVLLTPNTFNHDELAYALEPLMYDLNANKIDHTIADLWKRDFSATGLVVGDIGEIEARQLYERVVAGAQSMGARFSVRADTAMRVAPIVQPTRPVEVRALAPCVGDNSHVFRMWVLFGVPTVEERVLMGMLEPLLYERTFTELRTKRGLGYLVSADVDFMSNVMRVGCAVQGEKMLPDDIEFECERVWANEMPKKIAEMTLAEFAALKSSYRSKIVEPPTSHDNEARAFQEPILLGQCDRLSEHMLAYLDTVDSKDLLAKTWARLALPATPRKKVVVKYFATNSVPRRPSQRELLLKARAADLDDAATTRLLAESNVALVVPRARSSHRKLLTDGGFYPQELHCDAVAQTKGEVLADTSAAGSVNGDKSGGTSSFLEVSGDGTSVGVPTSSGLAARFGDALLKPMATTEPPQVAGGSRLVGQAVAAAPRRTAASSALERLAARREAQRL